MAPTPIGTVGTNTIIAATPNGMSLSEAKHLFKKFGDISNLDILSKKAVSVSFFDIRSVPLARKAVVKSKLGLQRGDRTVHMHGEICLSPDELSGVSNLIPHFDDKMGTSYTVEFFDTRDAHSARLAQEKVTPEAPQKVQDNFPPEPVLWLGLAY